MIIQPGHSEESADQCHRRTSSAFSLIKELFRAVWTTDESETALLPSKGTREPHVKGQLRPPTVKIGRSDPWRQRLS
jgi:hypothetical protein